MSKFKSFFQIFPEYYLLVLVLLAGYTPPISIALLSIIVAVILVLQIIFKNIFFGFFLAGLFAITNVYMLFALLSEFNEFTSFTPGARNLLLVGLPLFTFNIFVSVMMFRKYTLHIEKTDEQVEVPV